MFQGELVAIYIGPSNAGPMQRVDSIAASPGAGLSGDRYGTSASRPPKPDQEITLIESEAIEAATREYELEFTAGQSRRNLVTRGVPLNHLVGRTFTIGEVVIEGLRLCEPCGHLEKLTTSGIKKALIHRGGLRARIVRGGELRIGDAIRPTSAAAET